MAVAAAVGCGYLDLSPQVFKFLEQKTYGERLALATLCDPQLTKAAKQRVAIVALPDAPDSGPSQGSSAPVSPKLSRAEEARLITALTQDGAKVIACDMDFHYPRPQDGLLADAVRRSGRVVLACQDDRTLGRPTLVLPEPLLRNAGARWGHTRVPLDPEGPAIDRIEPVITAHGQMTPAFCVEAAGMDPDWPGQGPHRTTGGWRVGRLSVPVQADGTFRIRYFGPTSEVFVPIPFEQILAGSAGQRRFYRKWFANKVVLVGDMSGDNDVYDTPLGRMPGVEINAHAVATLLGGRFLRDAPPWAEVALLAVLAGAAALLASVWLLKRAALFLLLLLPAYCLFNGVMFVRDGLVLPLVAPSTAIVVTALGVLLERGITEEQEKTRVRWLLHRYVSPQIARHILQHPELLGRAGTRATGTVLFSDIRGFTALSEHLPPEELVVRLNEYFEAMTDIIFRHDGTAASIVGDGMLALFGIPVPYPDHARRAVAAAIEMQDTLRRLQDQWRARGQRVFDIGIGINTGEMVVGDVGSRQIRSFTVYGLQVNIASRVEALNKDLGSCILITRTTYQAVADAIAARGPLAVPVKGVEGKVEVFEVLGWQEGRPSAPSREAQAPAAVAVRRLSRLCAIIRANHFREKP